MTANPAELPQKARIEIQAPEQCISLEATSASSRLQYSDQMISLRFGTSSVSGKRSASRFRVSLCALCLITTGGSSTSQVPRRAIPYLEWSNAVGQDFETI